MTNCIVKWEGLLTVDEIYTFIRFSECINVGSITGAYTHDSKWIEGEGWPQSAVKEWCTSYLFSIQQFRNPPEIFKIEDWEVEMLVARLISAGGNASYTDELLTLTL